MITLKVPGSTSNLGSGFDTVGLALQCYLTIEVEFSQRGLVIETAGEGCADIPTTEKNLIIERMKWFYDQHGEELPDLHMRIDNQIPLSRGLGSSGAATIAGLYAAAKMLGDDSSKESLMNMAYGLEGHPENSASSLYGGLTISCFGDGKLHCKSISIDESVTAVLLIPEVNISTAAARKALPETVPHEDAVFNVQRSALLTHAFVCGEFDMLRIAMQDRLHQPYRKSLLPGYDEIEESGYGSGALGVSISGSGSAILGFTRDEERLKKTWRTCLQELGLNGRVISLSVDNEGAQCRE